MVEPRLGELLLREGVLDEDGLRTLLARLVDSPDRRSGEVLTEELLASDAVVSAALNAQLRARLEAVFRLSDADVRFHVRRPPRRSGPSSLLAPRDFLHGRRRARRDTAARRSGAEDAYRLLGLEPGASSESVRRAFRKLATEHHPDRHPGASREELVGLVQRFSRITAAYHRLGG
jgi:DnaJ-domain-containing protein 1